MATVAPLIEVFTRTDDIDEIKRQLLVKQLKEDLESLGYTVLLHKHSYVLHSACIDLDKTTLRGNLK